MSELIASAGATAVILSWLAIVAVAVGARGRWMGQRADHMRGATLATKQAKRSKQAKPSLKKTTYRVISESAKRGTTQVVLHNHWSDGSVTTRTKHVPTDQLEALYGDLEQSS